MIKRLRRRMTVMVIAVLVLVSAGIVLAIHLSIERNIAAQAESSLAVMTEENAGGRFSRETPPPKPEEDEDERSERMGKNQRGNRGQPLEIRDGKDAAGLGNSYTITLNDDGSVASWASERTDLYTDEQVSAIAESIRADGKESGRIGTQFYRKTTKDDKTTLLVLDARLDFLSAASTLRSTILIAAAACLLLSLLAWLLIRRMVRPVEEAFVRQKQFVSDASHELKTPLAVISANAEVLEQEIGENEYLGYIRSEVKRTDSLVRNLLTLARMDRNEVPAEMKPFDLSHALLDVVLPFESTVYEAGKTLETDIPDGIECCGNEEMIKQLAVILLSNALKYSDENGRIRISLAARGKQRELCVFNTGNPIPPEDQDKIFDRFWRGDPAHSRETGGHGLGLAIARSIVEAHRGSITVKSAENEGTVFTVLLNA
jgi:signal transduction histidine kinase